MASRFLRYTNILAFGLFGLLVAGGFIYLASTQAVAPEQGRVVLCIGIMSNTANPARFDSRVRALCADVGVYPLPADR